VVIAHREGDAGRRLLCDLDAVEARVQMNALAGSTGAFAWSAGFVMSEFAMSCPECVRDRRVIELGSGAGVCGAVLARLRPRALVLTDRDESTLENLARNVRANADGVNDANVPSRAYDVTFDAIDAPVVDDVSRVSIRALDWGRMSARDARALSPDVVLAADCAYDPDLIPSLVHAIRTLLDHSGRDASTDCGSFTTSSWSVDDARAFFLDDAPQRRSSPCAIVVSAVRQPKTMDVLINALVHDGALHVRDITSAFARLPIRFAHGDAERAHALDDCRAFLCTTTIAHDGNDDEYTQHKPSNSGSS
jgi:predicted nicotinamide N-methyase